MRTAWKVFLDKYFWSSRGGSAIVHGEPTADSRVVVIHYQPGQPCEFPRDMRTGVKMTPEAIHQERLENMSLREAQAVVRRYRQTAEVVPLRRSGVGHG